MSVPDGLVGAIFGLSALVLGFTFSSANTSYSSKLEEIRNESTAIKALYISSKYLEQEDREPFKQSLRHLLDIRTHAYVNIASVKQVDIINSEIISLVRKINEEGVLAAKNVITNNQPLIDHIFIPQLEKLTTVFDTSSIKLMIHPSKIIVRFLFILMIVGGVLSGYSMAVKNQTDWILSILYVALVTFTFHVILSLEYPNIFIPPEELNQDLLRLKEFIN